MKKVFKPKKCKIGGEQFIPIKPFQPTCFGHAGEWLRLQSAKKLEKTQKAQRKVMKSNIETLSDYQKILQPEINHIARLIDYREPCISCQRTTGQPQGGHYHSQGGNAMIRFNLHNIFLQDYRCNHQESANIIGFNKGLIEVYGKEYKEYLEFTLVREYKSVKPSIPELKEAIKRARGIVRRMKSDPQIRTPKERIALRAELNKEIGIYPE